ncbi:bifunctional 4-hydroxy-2-oxoglutarate aldolase/2-dehydro-3-deoxy-phosphogluconate aldolase [Roseomonas sp. USHLN139]|uniref:bifunctional 4-hydroxy-2-oxoglutarate aldolase/2-dehydro-3-deoxy-phosphogluconate aldolase n=1 Tax=Roseomonas sp. USHLN139 TaxID=3081298 RepID=UPI003B02D6AD
MPPTDTLAAPAAAGPLAALLAGRPPLIAILQVDRLEDALPLLDTLEAAGLPAIEVTLRSPQALGAIEVMRRRADRAVIGAGTLTRPAQFAQAREAGARFLVSPGLTPGLAQAAAAAGLPFLPGAVTPSEVLAAREHGFTELKFFPAELQGGPAWLRHMQPLFPEVRFCPTGGVSTANLQDYRALPNVFAVGGVFMAPAEAIRDRDWPRIGQLARDAVRAAEAAGAPPA